MNPKVDFFFSKPSAWQEEYRALREIVLGCGLVEELKWGVPCYTFQGKNICLIHGFKAYCALLFHKGVLLKDPESMLVQQTAQVQSARQLRFSAREQIVRQCKVIEAYIYEAVEVEESGRKVAMKKAAEFAVAPEFQQQLDAQPGLKLAFAALTPGRQRGYLLHFSSAKQSATRAARVEKAIPRIQEGKGLDD